MATTPKSERQAEKASAEIDRWSERSYAEPSMNPNHPTHVKQAEAFDRYHRKLAHHDRAYEKTARRELVERGWPGAAELQGDGLVQAHAIAQLDCRWPSGERIWDQEQHR